MNTPATITVTGAEHNGRAYSHNPAHGRTHAQSRGELLQQLLANRDTSVYRAMQGETLQLSPGTYEIRAEVGKRTLTLPPGVQLCGAGPALTKIVFIDERPSPPPPLRADATTREVESYERRLATFENLDFRAGFRMTDQSALRNLTVEVRTPDGALSDPPPIRLAENSQQAVGFALERVIINAGEYSCLIEGNDVTIDCIECADNSPSGFNDLSDQPARIHAVRCTGPAFEQAVEI